jgi:hypothetical protein
MTVADDVVVPAEGREVRHRSGTASGVRDAVIEIAFSSGHAATGVDAGAVASVDITLLLCGRPVVSGADEDEISGVRVGDGESYLGGSMGLCHLASDVGDDRFVSAELSGVVGELGEGAEIDVDVDGTAAAASRRAVAFEQIEQHIGAELVDAPLLVLRPQ